MAKFELPIYGADDEIVKTYQTEVVRFGILEDAIKVSENTKGKTAEEQLKSITPILQRVFKGLTEEELKDADLFNVFGVFRQIISLANGLNGSSNNKGEENVKN